MSNTLELTGKLVEVFEEVQISDTFKKREFVIDKSEMGNNGEVYTELIKFQLTQDRCSKIDEVAKNDMITVSFNVKGRKWEKEGKISYFTNLEAWKVVRTVLDVEQLASETMAKIDDEDNFLPF